MQKRIVILEYHKRERERAPSKTEQFKNIALGFAGIIASIAIPIVGLWLGYIQKDKEVLIADAEKNQEIQKSYVELRIRVLSDPPKPQSQPLREWAVKLINAHSAVALDGAAASAVVSDVPLTVPLPIRSAAQNCGGKERWGPKDGTDSEALNIDLTNITPEVVTDLVAIHQPHLPAPSDNTTRIVPDETHVYRVQARLVKWKHDSDGDYHMVLTDDTLNFTNESAHPPVPPTGHSFIGELPDPNCF